MYWKTRGEEEDLVNQDILEVEKPVGNAVKEMLVAIHKGELDYVCSDVMWHHWMTLYRGLSWWTEDTEGTNEYRRNLVFTKKGD